MRIKTMCLVVFLLFLVTGSELLAQSKVGVCPVEEGKEPILIEAPEIQEETVSSSKVYTVPRKQVQFEIGTATW